ncbi:MAG: hypothetical protein Q4F72_12180, partial [Desulfovibrionaceae bacterium]|nr:hypothetical protein [Desulfovibrionaceae bacterium]
TGFAAACALRQAAGIRAVMGHAISTLAVKALLVHGAAGSGTNGSGAAGSETAGPEKRLREDWGRIPEDLTALIASPDGTAAMVLQGELEAGLGLLAPLPLPAGGIRGNCRLRATLCCAWPARTADRRELAQPELHAVLTLDGEVPHEELAGRSGSDEAGLNRACRTDRTARTGRTDKTARLDRLGPELFFDWPLRPCEDGPGCRPVRWTNTLRGEGNFSGTSLRRPAFALWQRPADEDRDAGRVSPLPFALVLTMEAAEHPHLFEEILEAHGRLAHLVPRTVMLFEPETLGEDD